jgi:membrane protease YdiL (CAAX protease family)
LQLTMQPTDRATPTELLMTALGGFIASIYAPAVYLVIVAGTVHRQPTPHQTVCTFAIQAAAGFLMIQAINLSQKQNNLSLRLLPKGLVLSVAGAFFVFPMVFITTSVVQKIMDRMGASAPTEHPLLIVFQHPGSLDRALVILSAVILAPLFEELTFRAHLQTALGRITKHRWPAILIASVLFALIHQIWWMMPPLFVLAIGLGYVYDRSKNLWASVFMHASFNALSLAVEYYSMKHP